MAAWIHLVRFLLFNWASGHGENPGPKREWPSYFAIGSDSPGLLGGSSNSGAEFELLLHMNWISIICWVGRTPNLLEDGLQVTVESSRQPCAVESSFYPASHEPPFVEFFKAIALRSANHFSIGRNGGILNVNRGDHFPGNCGNAGFEGEPCHDLLQGFLFRPDRLQIGLHVYAR